LIQFAGTAVFIKDEVRRAPLRHTFHLQPEELSNSGKGYLDLIDSAEFERTPLFVQAEWALFAIIELQDLQAVTITQGRPFPNTSNYLFFEGLSALREAVLAAHNNTIHASLTLLRTVVELMVYHLWWQSRLDNDDGWRKFSAWLLGNSQERDLGLKRVMREVYDQQCLPSFAHGFDDLYSEYATLCTYVHKPLLAQSVVTIRGTNQPAASAPALRFWLERVGAVSRCLLDLLISSKPQSLFPVDLCRKFGFNPPIGLFFDQSGFTALKKAMSPEKLELYRKHYASNPDLESLADFYNTRPDLGDVEILETWKEEEPESERESATVQDRIALRYTMMKAKMRALHWTAAYGGFSDPPWLAETIGSALSRS